MNGFAATIDRKAIVKSMRQAKNYRPGNIDAYVQKTRERWDREYLTESIPTVTWQDIFSCSPYINETDAKPADLITNQEFLYNAVCGHWCMAAFKEDKKPSFMFGVWTGDRFCFHPGQARMFVESAIGTEGFHDWVATVKANFKPASKRLIAEMKQVVPQYSATSVTALTRQQDCYLKSLKSQLSAVLRSLFTKSF